MVTVFVPSLFRTMCGGVTRLEVESGRFESVLRGVDRLCPGFYDRVVEGGRMRPELAVAVNGEVIGVALHEVIADGAELAIVPAIGGG